MGLEVALLQWTDGPQGEAVRLLGRCADVRIVELVQAHLRNQLGDESPPAGGSESSPSPSPGLRLIPDDHSSVSEPDQES